MTILSGCSDRVLENEDLEGHLLRRLVYEGRFPLFVMQRFGPSQFSSSIRLREML